MSENSKIEWTDHTFNPWEGCQKVSQGCDHCYAETRNARFAGGTAINWGPGAPRRRTSPANWRKPLQWNKAHAEFFAQHGRRQRVFCASLADVFDNDVDRVWRGDLFRLIEQTPNLDWLLLTKRIGNAMRLLPSHDWCMGRDNVWLGATVVNQEEALRDVPKLMQVPSRHRFLSIEPMLGPIDLTEVNYTHSPGYFGDAFQWHHLPYCNRHEPYPSIDWVICGGESGSGGRPMHPSWPRDLRDQCAEAGVPFLFKQWGEWMPAEHEGDRVTLRFASADATGPRQPDWHEWPDKQISAKVGKRAAARTLDGGVHDGFPKA